MNAETPVCRRCGSPVEGRYCAQCGQHRAEPLDLGRLWRDTVGKLTELDIRLLRTVRELSLRPGWMVREYLEGNRASWTNPGKYMFWMATVYAVVLTLLVEPERLNVRMFGETVSRQELLLIMGAIAYLAFVYLLLAGAAARGLFRGALRSVAEGYVALLYIYGHALFVLSVVAALGHWHPLTVRLFLLVYMTWTLTQLAGRPLWKGVLKGLLVYVVYMLASMVTVGGFFVARQLIGGQGG